MGLFDKISYARQNSQITLGLAEAFAAIILIAVASDGYVADSEVQAIVTDLSRMQLFRSYSGDVMRKIFDHLLNLLQRKGADALLRVAIEVLPHELQETVFAVTTDIILSDGDITEEEEKFLEQLYGALEISEETAIKIIDVMLIKNRG